MQALLDRAKRGDIAAIRELLDRTVGKPIEPDLVDRIETMEAIIEEK